MSKEWFHVTLCSLLASGCILEPNPEFMPTANDGSTGGTDTDTGTTSTLPGTTVGPTTMDPDTTAGTTDTTGDDTGGGPTAGCDDPLECTPYHVGPIEGSCTHEVDGVPTDECDWVGPYALRIAVATLEVEGGHGLVVMHDNNGVTASYVGGIDVPGDITIRAADGLSPNAVRVFSQDSSGTLRLRGNDVHLEGFTVVCRSGGEWAIAVREDLDTQGTETGGHLIERMVMVASRPENVGSNSIEPVFQSIGPDTVIRNNHMWGYFEGTLDMRFATDGVFSHNTLLYYQRGGNPAIDATQVDGLEISNNVFASLTGPEETLVAADDSTLGLVLVGNAAEGYANVLGGLETIDPDVTYADNTNGPLELESPRNPLVLVDSTLSASAMGVASGTSLDGTDLGGATQRIPGAFQTRSVLSLPRRSVITVGDAMCGGTPCDVTKSFENELQRAVWSAWPGSVVEVYPSGTPYAGPLVVSWPIQLRGMGSQPDDVVIRRQFEDEILTNDGLWWGKEAVIDLTRSMGDPTLVEMLTVEASADEIGIYHEGRGSAILSGLHEIRRVILRDDGSVAGDPADMALYIGDDVVVHDVLIHGGYDTCVRFGPRSWEGSETPPVTAYVHNLTCRLTEPSPGTTPLAAFEVASVDGVIMADIAVELSQPGPLFRAQRRTSGDTDPLVAADPPLDFVAQSIVAIGHDADFDGYTALDGAYTLVDVDTVGIMEPFFVGPVDSHLQDGALGIDGGVDPVTLDPGLSLGVALDGVDRSGQVPDRGCYEQGL